MDEQSVVTKIKELVRQLNGELKAAHELGLRLSVSGTGTFLPPCPPQGPQVLVRIWKEEEIWSSHRGES